MNTLKMTIQFSWPIHHVFFSFREKPCVNLGMLKKTKNKTRLILAQGQVAQSVQMPAGVPPGTE